MNKQEDIDFFENNLTFYAICGIQDPLRPEIVKSVQQCKDAGILVRMVTGDNIETARAIALNAGILQKEDLKQEFSCMLGSQFREYVGNIVQVKDETTGKMID